MDRIENFSGNETLGLPRPSFRQQIGKMTCHVWRTIAEISNDILLTSKRIGGAIGNAFTPASPPSSLPASHAPIGGVVNVGNSCYISLVLQQFAAEPEFFNLQFGEEANGLKQKMMSCIDAIQKGKQVSKIEMQDLVKALSENGWTERAGDPGDPLELLTFVSTILKINQFAYEEFIGDMTPDPVVYIRDSRSAEIEKLYHPKNIKVLWIINNPNPKQTPQEIIRTKTHVLALREIHMTQTFFFGSKHIYCMRKEEGTWYKCSDAEITAVALKNMPTSHMRRLVYLATPIEAL